MKDFSIKISSIRDSIGLFFPWSANDVLHLGDSGTPAGMTFSKPIYIVEYKVADRSLSRCHTRVYGYLL